MTILKRERSYAGHLSHGTGASRRRADILEPVPARDVQHSPACFIYNEFDGAFWPITRLGRYAEISGRVPPHSRRPPGRALTCWPCSRRCCRRRGRTVRLYYLDAAGRRESSSSTARCPLADVAAIVRPDGRRGPCPRRVAAKRRRATILRSGRRATNISSAIGPASQRPDGVVRRVYHGGRATPRSDARLQYSYEVGIAVDEERNNVIYWLDGHAEEVPAGRRRP